MSSRQSRFSPVTGTNVFDGYQCIQRLLSIIVIIVPNLLLTIIPKIPVRICWRSVHRFLLFFADTSPGVYGCECIAWTLKFSVYSFTRSGASFRTSRFSAFLSSAALVKLNEPVMMVALSMIIILLWAIIGKYLSSLRTLNHVILLKEGFEAQLRASRLSIPCRMSAAGMTRQIRDGRLDRGIEPGHVPAL